MGKCSNCKIRYHCDEQTEYLCKFQNYPYYMPEKEEERFKFGKVLIYESPLNGHWTKCVYVRHDKEQKQAIVIFENAEQVARVNYNFLKDVTI